MPAEIDSITNIEDVLREIQATLEAQGDVPPEFDLIGWAREWVQKPQHALGGVRPIDLMGSPEGLSSVRRLLGSLISGAYQ